MTSESSRRAHARTRIRAKLAEFPHAAEELIAAKGLSTGVPPFMCPVHGRCFLPSAVSSLACPRKGCGIRMRRGLLTVR